MKFGLYILLLLVSSQGMYAQQWRDTLMAARKSYVQKNYEQSLKLYRSAKKLAPKEIDLSDEVGQSAYKAGKYEQAEKMYAQSSSNKGSAAQKGITQRQIGNARMKQEKYAEAIESYKESLRNNPKDEYARYNLAQAMKKKAQQDKKQQQDKQDQQDQQNKDQQNKQDQQQNNPGQKNQPEKQKNQGEQGNSKKENQGEQPKDQPKPQQENRDQNPSGNQRNKLSDKKTERMLDKLMKQEMETKRKFDGVKSSGNTSNSGKDW